MEDVQKESVVRGELETLLHKEEVMWAQKARNDWILMGDRNTHFYQTVVRQRRARNRILQFQKPDGCLTEDQGEIKDILVRHFRQSDEVSIHTEVDQILEEIRTLPIPKLSSHQLSLLDSPITNEEIEFTMFQLGLHKAPGLDGIPAFFYQEYWNIVKFDIFNAIHAFFHSGSLLKALNHT